MLHWTRAARPLEQGAGRSPIARGRIDRCDLGASNLDNIDIGKLVRHSSRRHRGLPALSEPLARSVEETPHNLGIRIRAGTWVVAIDAEEVRLETGEIIPAELIVLLCGPRVTMTWDDKLI